MKAPLIVSFLALVLSAVALAAMLTTALSTEPRAVDPALPSAAASDADILAQLKNLAEENRDLRDRLAILELIPASSPSQRVPVTAGFVPKEEFEAFRDEVRLALASSGALDDDALTALPGFKKKVADTLSEIRHEEAVGKVRTRIEARLAKLDETMPRIDEWLELTPQQSSSMRTALLAQYDREAELVRRWEAGEDTEILGELKRSDREAHRNELAGFLTPAQLETYTSRGGGGGK
ncbi:MAG: hypothetical protein E2O39_02725 [Planctomycetota bacterium]|nr:MAG: hypothetical protein E2O39_02725 [Planctomycetota bacterium]